LKKDGSSADGKSFVLNALQCFGISRLSVSKMEVLEGCMEGKRLVITCTLTVNNQEIPTHALNDCGATGIAFMDPDYAHHHQIPLQELKEKPQVEVIDRRPIECGDITHLAQVRMKIQDHEEQLPMFITKLRHYPIVLGIPCLQLHDVAVQFALNTGTFGSQYCMARCHDEPITVQGVTEELHNLISSSGGKFELQIRPQQPFCGSIVMLNRSPFFWTVKTGKLKVFKASLYDINKAIEAKDFKERPMDEVIPKQYHLVPTFFS